MASPDSKASLEDDAHDARTLVAKQDEALIRRALPTRPPPPNRGTPTNSESSTEAPTWRPADASEKQPSVSKAEDVGKPPARQIGSESRLKIAMPAPRTAGALDDPTGLLDQGHLAQLKVSMQAPSLIQSSSRNAPAPRLVPDATSAARVDSPSLESKTTVWEKPRAPPGGVAVVDPTLDRATEHHVTLSTVFSLGFAVGFLVALVALLSVILGLVSAGRIQLLFG